MDIQNPIVLGFCPRDLLLDPAEVYFWLPES